MLIFFGVLVSMYDFDWSDNVQIPVDATKFTMSISTLKSLQVE